MTTMYDPVHPGESLRDAMDAEKWTVTEAAVKLSCKRWTPNFGQVAKVGSRPRRRSLACHERDGVIRLS